MIDIFPVMKQMSCECLKSQDVANGGSFPMRETNKQVNAFKTGKSQFFFYLEFFFYNGTSLPGQQDQPDNNLLVTCFCSLVKIFYQKTYHYDIG